MEETLHDGDLVISLNNGKYQTGDVIGFYFNNGILIKRVIAVSGDWVDFDEDGTVYVNGTRLEEPYATDKSIGECNISLPYQVLPGSLTSALSWPGTISRSSTTSEAARTGT